MKQLVILLAASLGSASIAAPLVDVPRNVPFSDAQGSPVVAHLPWIVGGEPGVAERANSYAYDAFFNTLPTRDPKDFRTDLLDIMELASEGIKLTNGGRTARLSVAIELCGAHCGNGRGTLDYDFDTATGRPVAAVDVLLPDAEGKLKQLARKVRFAALHQLLARLKKNVARKSDAREQDQIALYEQCLESAESDAIKRIDLGSLFVGDGSLGYLYFQCASTSAAALDDLGESGYVAKGMDMRPYLNAYGLKLLLGEGDGAAPLIQKSGQLFKGTINGNLAVTLFVGAESDRPAKHAHYYYDKYRQKIWLDLRRNGDTFTLTEKDKDGKASGVMTLELSGAKLTGEWRSGSKRLPVALTAY